ncbi:MAG: phosphatidylserine decarboxylase [Planctomycetota bacterium]
MMLAKYGTAVWLPVSLVLTGLCALAAWLFWPVVFLPALLLGWVLWFFRDPQRQAPGGCERFVSPADGVVTDITPLGSDSPLGCEGMQVGVFMSVFSVHVNRAPCDGTIEKIEHRDGTFLDVRKPEGWEKNESTTITMSIDHAGRRLPVVFRQIAGLVARRIITDLQIGQSVERGQRVGMIRFGPRCELLVPNEILESVTVQVGQKVQAGTSELIRIRRADSQTPETA